jgi:two-component system sensor kinase FixL
MDVTQGKLEDEPSYQFERKLRRFFKRTVDAIAAIDMAGRIHEFNPAFPRMLDYPAEELRGLTCEDITPNRWHALDAQILRDQVLPRGYSDVYEKEFRKKDGTVFPVELRTVLIRDESGQPAEMWVVVRDVTERRRKEEAVGRLRTQAWRSDCASRLSAVTALLGHELRQPLAAILSNAEAAVRLLDRENPSLDEIREILNDIVLDDQHASAVISEMSGRLRRRDTRREEVCLAETIQEALALLDGEIAAHEIQSSFCRKADCVVSADKACIRQVLVNLVTNAVEAMQSRPAHERRLKVALELAGPGMALVTVSDSGPGVPDPQSGTLFGPFRTTGDQGMGIGLYICRSIIQAHGGRIWFRNNQDGGAAFSFTLPLVTITDPGKQTPGSSASETGSASREGFGERSTIARILLVDDSESYRRALWSMLASVPLMELAGEAADGVEAVQKAGDLKPHLILLDVSLTGVNGIEAASRIRLVAPGSRMIFLSNFDDPDVVRAALHTGALGYVLKVDTGRELLPAMAAVLRGETFLSTGVQDCASTGSDDGSHVTG